MKTKDINWITDNIEDKFIPYQPNDMLLSNNEVDHAARKTAFVAIFAPKSG